MTKLIEVELNNILNLVCCAEDYGYTTLYSDFAGMTGWVSDEDIAEYVNKYVDIGEETRYSEEDRENAVNRLTEWREDYCDKNTVLSYKKLRSMTKM